MRRREICKESKRDRSMRVKAIRFIWLIGNNVCYGILPSLPTKITKNCAVTCIRISRSEEPNLS